MKFKGLLPIMLVVATATPCLAKGNVRLADVQAAVIEENFQVAHDLAKTFIKQTPPKSESDQAQYYLGLSLLWLNKPAKAKEVFYELTRYEPEPSVRDRALVGIIDAHYMEEHYRESIQDAETFLRDNSGSEFISLVYLKLARAYLKLAEWGVAKNYLSKIMSAYPNSPEAHSAKQLLEEKHYFAVQVGSFLEVERANSLTEELQRKGEYAYTVQTTDLSGRKFYRVRVGKFSLLKEAKSLSSKLAKLGYPTRIYP